MTSAREAVVPAEKHPLRVGMENGDAAAVISTLADDVVFWSPTATKPFVGKKAAGEIIEILIDQFEGLEYPEEYVCGSTEIVRFRGRLAGWPIEGAEFLRENAEGKVCEIHISARPLSGVAAVAKAVGPGLGRRRGGLVNQLVVFMLAHFTPRILDTGERIADRFYRERP